MNNIYYSGSGNTVTLDREIGRGGEGLIYLIHGYPSDVAKIYMRQQSPEVHRKILAMVQSPPHDPTVNGPTKHRSIAWPNEVLYSDRQKTQFAGFIMPRIDMKAFIKILHCIDPESRKKTFQGGFTWLHLYTAAYNLASCIAAIHERGYCVGDINESNILVQPSTPLTIIDCDSFQVRDQSSGKTWRCTVGKPEYTAPEILGNKYEDVDRTKETDCFALAVMIFQLLMEGFHPYAATGALVDNAPNTQDKIKLGFFAFGISKRGISQPPSAPSFDILHPEMRALFLRCFDVGHNDPSVRPTAKDWMAVLKKLTQSFMKCSQNTNHLYLNHLRSCPWCERAEKTGKDSFPSPIGQQVQIIDPNNQMISQQEREAYLLSFIDMALMDGYLSAEEEVYLIDQGLKLHIPEKDTKRLIVNEIHKRGLSTVYGGQPRLKIDKTFIEFKDVMNGAILHEIIEISNIGNGILTGAISSNVKWIKVPASIAPNINNQSQKIQLTVDTSGLPFAFSGVGTVSIRTTGGNVAVSVSLTVGQKPTFATTPNSVPVGSATQAHKFPRAIIFIAIATVIGIMLLSNNNRPRSSVAEHYSPPVNTYTPPVPTENYSGYPSPGRYPQNTPSVIKEYFQNRFQFSVKSVDIVNEQIIVTFEINTLTNGDYFFLCSKQNISDSVNSTYKPYIEDSKSVKHEMIGGPTGDILQNVFPDNEGGYSPDRTYRFKLRPNETVAGRMEFPMISEGTRTFSLVIPGVNGWQSEIKIDNIQLIHGESLPADEQEAASRQTWKTYKTDVGQIRVARAFICRSMTYGSPSDAVTSVSEESLREWTGRGQLIYYIEYENAIPNDTRIHVQWFREGTPIGNPCNELLQRSSGPSSCRLEYPFTAANYEARLTVDGQNIDNKSLTVVRP